MTAPKFSLSSLLMVTAFIGVTLGAWTAVWNLLVPAQRDYLAQTLFFLGPFWFPFVFVGYAVGCRAMTVWTVLAFAICEAAVLGVAFWLSS